MINVTERLRKEIREKGRGRIIFIDDFPEYESPWTIRYGLSKLAEDGMLIRLARGIYCYPSMTEGYSPKAIIPSPETIAEAVARKERIRIIPYGDQAAYKLGLTGLRVSDLKYLTDGAPRKICLANNVKIYFNHTSEVKMFDYHNQTMMDLCMAVRMMGEDMIGEEQKRIIREQLRKVPEKDYLRDISIPPAWVQEIISSLWNS